MNSQNKPMVMMQKLFNPSQYRLTSGLGTLNKENYIRVMRESINKAINSDEGPVKEKHVRRLLIATYQFESAQFFWDNLPVLRLKENQIVCWKFCYVVHKLVRDGHKKVLPSCLDRRQILLDCGNLWRHVSVGYGPLIHSYCEFLFNRIKYHNDYEGEFVPLDSKVTDDLISRYESMERGEDILYQLAMDMLDMMDAIILLSDKVLDSVNTMRLSSTSSAGRCHLSPLVACIQDASSFYDITVKVAFKLHSSPGLTASFMELLRGRFNDCHNGIRRFFGAARTLQYFKTLIQIPQLPAKPPNFEIASELERHVAPQVILISEANECESSDHGLLVNIDDDDASSHADEMESNISGSVVHHATSEPSTSSLFEPTNGSDETFLNLDSSSNASQTKSAQIEGEEVLALKQKVLELNEQLVILSEQLEREKSDHERTKQESSNAVDKHQAELNKLRHEISSMRHQIAASKNAHDKLFEECERAKHDNEISQYAMKRLMKEMSELKTKQRDELQQVRQDATKEADTREEDLLVAEMNETDKIIREATRKIEELSEKSRQVESGIKLQVNEKISEVCTNLMKAVRNLIAQSRLLQKEIVASKGKETNRMEFYKQNSSWTEGLISAANVVAMAARSLVEAADRSMSNQARFSELAAAAHEVASATTQLVVASRVKANKDSEKLRILTSAAKQVNQCTSNVVEASRVCAQLVEHEVDKIDISTLSLHQTKKLEMETQVRLLELEESLTKERTKLGVLRRQHYEQEEKQANEANQM